MEMAKNSLPKGWKEVSLKEIGIASNQSIIPSNFPDETFELWSVPNFEFNEPEYLLGSEIGSNKCVVRENDVLLCKINPRINRVWKVRKGDKYRQIASPEWIVVRNDSVNPDFIAKQLQSQKIRTELLKDVSGVGGSLMRARPNAVKELRIVLPPLPEQQRIVAKIEELFSELDAGRRELEQAAQGLKAYRQAVLKWAFEGRLTNDAVVDGELPEGWQEVELGTLMESVRNGYSKKPDEAGSYEILRISSVRPNKLDIKDTRWLKERLPEENQIQENDLLFTRYNGSRDFVGVSAIVPMLDEPIFYPDKLIRCRPKLKDKKHSLFLQYVTNYGKARSFVLNRIKTTAGQTGIAGAEIKQMPVLLPPFEEQHRIVEEIEARLSVCDKIEETISQSMRQAEALRQSILKKAFEGKLIY